MVALQRHERNTWRDLSDEALRHYRQLYRRMRANLPDDVEDPALRASTERFLTHLLTAIRAEIDWRLRAKSRGVPIERDRFAPEFKDALKARVHLDAMIEREAGIALGRPSGRGVRRGPCPFCGGSAHSDKFVVFASDDAAEWFYCHACGQSGDAITFLELHYGHTFPVAVEVLAAMCGVPLPDAPPPPSQHRYLAASRRAVADA